MSERVLRMNLGDRSYSIIIGKNVIKHLSEQIPAKTSRIIIIADKRLKKVRAEVLKALKNHPQVHEISVTAGEKLKDFKTLYPLYGELLKLKADRHSLIIAVGGGSVGDAVGFLAATFLRGIPWIGVPTTLLAQVDSSVGGKTGINHASGKNLIGSFHQPCAVICDTNFLSTLGPQELVSGLGEVVKYACTFDPEFFQWLEKNLPRLLKLDPLALTHAIEKSLEWKCEMVGKDEFDKKGSREILNFGHTLGHAVETVTGYKTYQHGEAVLLGMRFATELSVVRGKLSRKEGARVEKLLSKLPVRALPKTVRRKDIFTMMKKDKKAEGDLIRFVLLSGIGKTVSDKEVTRNDLEASWKKVFGKEKK